MLTPPFATIVDLAARWRPLTAPESTRATTLLLDASQLLLDEDARGILTALTVPTLTHKRIVCKIVERAMGTPVEEPSVTQQSQTMGTFTEQRTFANPTGDLYLTKAERRQLRFSRQRAGNVAMWAEPVA